MRKLTSIKLDLKTVGSEDFQLNSRLNEHVYKLQPPPQAPLKYEQRDLKKKKKDMHPLGFPDGSVGKESACNAGDTGDAGSLLGSGRSPGGGNGNPLQDACLGNPMDRRVWGATVQRVTELDMTKHEHNLKNENQIYLQER